jgi:hypothetical protein
MNAYQLVYISAAQSFDCTLGRCCKKLFYGRAYELALGCVLVAQKLFDLEVANTVPHARMD